MSALEPAEELVLTIAREQFARGDASNIQGALVVTVDGLAEAVNRVRLVLGTELPPGTVPDYATGWAHAMAAVGRALGDLR